MEYLPGKYQYMHRLKTVIYLISALIINTSTGAQPGSKTLVLHLVDKAGDSLLQKGATCQNAFGETFTVRNFNYYLSHIQLAGKERHWIPVSDSSYLVTLDDAESHRINLTVQGALPAIKHIRFLVGVDSSKNVAGVQTGTLDPARGMFWTWNTGYVMAKLEGRSAASSAPAHYFTYHIGGYKKGEAAARWVELTADTALAGDVYIAADVLKWFKGKNDIRIAQYPVCHEPGTLAMLLADNYASMFSIIQVP